MEVGLLCTIKSLPYLFCFSQYFGCVLTSLLKLYSKKKQQMINPNHIDRQVLKMTVEHVTFVFLGKKKVVSTLMITDEMPNFIDVAL